MRGPLERYCALVAAGALEPDPAQEAIAEKLDALSARLVRDERRVRIPFSRADTPPRGLYLWGGVGRGKTLLMDIFFNNTALTRKARVHFHEFMIDAHERIGRWRAADAGARRAHRAYDRRSPDDPIPYAAADIADGARLLCFDEFQVSDITDAMILGRLFGALFECGVVVVATSNRPPDDLYKDGLNRQLFTPFIDILKARCEPVEIESGEDYRLKRLTGAPVYYQPLGREADGAMDAAWERMICGATERRETLLVKGRRLVAARAARDAARFTFAELCEAPLGAADYLALARRFGSLFLDRIPRMSRERRNEAKRFVTLIDALYDARVKLVCSADGEPQDLYPAGDGAFEFERTASRLMEMRSQEYLKAAHVAPPTPSTETTD